VVAQNYTKDGSTVALGAQPTVPATFNPDVTEDCSRRHGDAGSKNVQGQGIQIMGYSARRKALAASNGNGQPIPAESLKALYPDALEIQLAMANQRLESLRVNALAAAYNAKIAALKIDQAEWSIDLKAGKMTRINPAKEDAP
jgi:hypothetical protein